MFRDRDFLELEEEYRREGDLDPLLDWLHANDDDEEDSSESDGILSGLFDLFS